MSVESYNNSILNNNELKTYNDSHFMAGLTSVKRYIEESGVKNWML